MLVTNSALGFREVAPKNFSIYVAVTWGDLRDKVIKKLTNPRCSKVVPWDSGYVGLNPEIDSRINLFLATSILTWHLLLFHKAHVLEQCKRRVKRVNLKGTVNQDAKS